MQAKYYRYLLFVALAFFAGALSSFFFWKIPFAGILMIPGFIALAWGVRGYPALKGFSYTLWIFTAVTASMFFPQYFTSIGKFQLKSMIVPLLQVIMFGMGSQMSFEDFKGVIKMPKGVLIGIFSQFTVMPLVGFTIARIFNFPPEIAAGIILIGCVPSGLASNVMSFLAKANLALAVTISAVTTLLSPFITPVLMKWLGGQFIEVDFWSMMLDILNMIILPIIAGFMFNLFARKNAGKSSLITQLIVYPVIILLTTFVFARARSAETGDFFIQLLKSLVWFYLLPMAGGALMSRNFRGNSRIMERALSFISMAGIAVIVTIITASGRESLLQVGALLMVTSLLHNLTGYTLGYTISWLFRMPERDRRTIAFEVGMQNGGLASGLALQMGKIATVGLAPAIFGPLMNITGSVLANWWRGRPVKEKEAV
ncbi:MAG: bile acid:sodium symporter family protein [Bacteroidota bacterium]